MFGTLTKLDKRCTQRWLAATISHIPCGLLTLWPWQPSYQMVGCMLFHFELGWTFTHFNQDPWQKWHIWLQILEYKNTTHSPAVLKPSQIIFLCRNRALPLFECSFCYWRLEPSSLGIGRICSPASWDLQERGSQGQRPFFQRRSWDMGLLLFFPFRVYPWGQVRREGEVSRWCCGVVPDIE